MNIGFDASRAFIKNRTGTENYSYQLLKHLLQLDHTNKYYVYIRPDIHPASSFQHPTSNCKFITLPYPRLWTQLGLALQTFKDPLNILFIPAHTLPLIRRPGLKTVVTVHDLGAEYLPSTHQLKQRLYLNFMTRHQLQSATHLIAVSQATRDDLMKKTGLPEEKISVIHEGFDSRLFKPVKEPRLSEILSVYGLQPKTYFLFVGTIQPRKNLSGLIEAYAQTSIPALVLAGPKGWLSEEIYKLPQKLGIGERVKFLGYVPDGHLPALYSGARAFVYPSLFEGFGLPILEAFSCGCPVLTSNISSMPEVAGPAALLVNPRSVDEITRGLLSLSSDPRVAQKLVKIGFAQARKFSWERTARETLRLLEKL